MTYYVRYLRRYSKASVIVQPANMGLARKKKRVGVIFLSLRERYDATMKLAPTPINIGAKIHEVWVITSSLRESGEEAIVDKNNRYQDGNSEG